MHRVIIISMCDRINFTAPVSSLSVDIRPLNKLEVYKKKRFYYVEKLPCY